MVINNIMTKSNNDKLFIYETIFNFNIFIYNINISIKFINLLFLNKLYLNNFNYFFIL